jgi:hypothetical protein
VLVVLVAASVHNLSIVDAIDTLGHFEMVFLVLSKAISLKLSMLRSVVVARKIVSIVTDMRIAILESPIYADSLDSGNPWRPRLQA